MCMYKHSSPFGRPAAFTKHMATKMPTHIQKKVIYFLGSPMHKEDLERVPRVIAIVIAKALL